MPELPEVETIRRQLSALVVGRTVVAAGCFDAPPFVEAPRATGWSVTGLRRRGKYLIATLAGPVDDGVVDRPVPAGRDPIDGPAGRELVVHLGMTGRLAVVGLGDLDRSHHHLRAWWVLDGADVLTLHDPRRFGRVAVVAPGDYRRLPTLCRLGPEPFDDAFDAERIRSALRGRRPVKSVLLAQRAVAGVGNIYADEALWAARIRPAARRLGPGRAQALRDAVRTVLNEAIDHGGTTLRDYRDARGAAGGHQRSLRCYGRAGLACVRCHTTMRATVLDGRGTTWCPTCQT